MSKSALGRGLGNLLGETKIVTQPGAVLPSPEETATQTEISPGLGNLLKGRNGQGTAGPTIPAENANTATHLTDNQPLATSTKHEKSLLRWALVGADILLLALASLLVFKSQGPLSIWEWLICVVAVGLGAGLGCAALLARQED